METELKNQFLRQATFCLCSWPTVYTLHTLYPSHAAKNISDLSGHVQGPLWVSCDDGTRASAVDPFGLVGFWVEPLFRGIPQMLEWIGIWGDFWIGQCLGIFVMFLEPFLDGYLLCAGRGQIILVRGDPTVGSAVILRWVACVKSSPWMPGSKVLQQNIVLRLEDNCLRCHLSLLLFVADRLKPLNFYLNIGVKSSLLCIWCTAKFLIWVQWHMMG